MPNRITKKVQALLDAEGEASLDRGESMRTWLDRLKVAQGEVKLLFDEEIAVARESVEDPDA
jgi:hypothetical protein